MKTRLLLLVALSLIPMKAVAVEGSKPAPAASKPGTAAIYTIEDLYKKGAELEKKKVVVRGEAVKVTPNIMGKVWTHIQDGTGDRSNGTHDLICISDSDRPEVGDMVTVTGTVVLNQGSRYKLVLEDASITK